ncbi:MAG: type II secretion system F family protein [Steroidobacteraceae bacterium]
MSAGTVIGLLAGVTGAATMLLGAQMCRRIAQGYREQTEIYARVRLADLFLFLEPADLLTAASIAFVIAVGAAYMLAGSVVAALVALLVVAAPGVAYRRLRARRRRRLALQLPDALQSLAGALRSGLSLSASIAELSRHQPPPISQELGLMARKQRLGQSLDSAADELASRAANVNFRMFVTLLRVARETGGGVADALDDLAGSLRRQLTLEGRLLALTSQGRLQAIIVGLLPLVLAVALGAMDSNSMRPLWTTWPGWLTLITIGFLEGVGFYMIRRIVAVPL